MKIGLLVEGEAEFHALPKLLPRLPTQCTVLKTCSRKRAYDKKTGAIEICKKLDPERARNNSRSFRKLLKTLGCAEPPEKSVRGRARRK